MMFPHSYVETVWPQDAQEMAAVHSAVRAYTPIWRPGEDVPPVCETFVVEYPEGGMKRVGWSRW